MVLLFENFSFIVFAEEARNGPVRGMAMDTPGLVSLFFKLKLKKKKITLYPFALMSFLSLQAFLFRTSKFLILPLYCFNLR